MGDPLALDGFVLFIGSVALLAILEIFFLFARLIESERSLHDLRVRSHTLRRQMIENAAYELIEQWEQTRRSLARTTVRAARSASMSESDQAEEPVMVIPMEADSESPTTALAA